MTASATLEPLARVQLARGARTQFAFPVLLCLVGAGLVILAVVAWLTAALPAAVTILLAVIGIGVQAAGWGLGLRIRSLRLAVEPDYLHLTGLRVDRRYHLAPGNLARVPSAGVTRPRRPGTLGRAVGKATLRTTGETIELIQLGDTPSVIVVPTERGRVALAAAAEAELIDALMAAARTRAARPALAAVSSPATAGAVVVPPAGPAPSASSSAVAASALAAATEAPTPIPPRPAEPAAPPRPLTGIERMELEERLAVERRAAITGAQSEHAAASLTASSAAMTLPGRPATPFPAIAPSTPTVAPSPAAATAIAPSAAPAVAAAASIATAPATVPAAPTRVQGIPRALPRRRPQRPMARRVGPASLWPDIAMLGGPLAVTAVVWAIAVFVGSRPGASGLDPIGLALLLCGPIAVLAAWLARSRWPRLAGLTSIAAVISLALVVRALIG